MIDSVIDTVSPPEIISEGSDIDEGNSGTDDEEISSGDEESEDSEDTKAFKELLPSLTCQFCNKLFSNHSNKLRHERFKHGASGLSWAEHCQIDPSCKKVYSNATALRYHQLKAHGKALKCGKCSQEFNDYKEYLKHRRREKGKPEPQTPKVVKCKWCEASISIRHLQRHNREVHNVPMTYPFPETGSVRFPCPVCEKSFKREETMRRHQSEVHSDSNREKKKCPDCEKSFTLERNLQRHVKRVHSTFFNTFKCDQCIKSFDKKENLKRHKKEVHCDEVSSCPSCGKSFKRKSNQERHSRSACKMLRK